MRRYTAEPVSQKKTKLKHRTRAPVCSQVEELKAMKGIEFSLADRLVENVISTISIPIGVVSCSLPRPIQSPNPPFPGFLCCRQVSRSRGKWGFGPSEFLDF